jgi:hypothetical protein
MKNRVKIVLALFLIAGIAAIVIVPRKYPAKDEEWMRIHLPKDIEGYSLRSAVQMDKSTYEILQPFGIIGYDFTGPDGRRYEYVVISGNTRKSFHDPQICFSAQNWVLENPRLREVNIPAMGGRVPATVMGLKSPSASGTAMYFYKTPNRLVHDPFYMPIDMTLAKLSMKGSVDGAFYRFIVAPAGDSLEEDLADLEKFAQAFFEATMKMPEGEYFLYKN